MQQEQTMGVTPMELQKDKILHFAAGMFVATIVVSVSALWERNLWLLAGMAISSSFVVGGAKELYDLITKRGVSEWEDLGATALGGLAVAVVVVTCI
jgi:hypothetical protein